MVKILGRLEVDLKKVGVASRTSLLKILAMDLL